MGGLTDGTKGPEVDPGDRLTLLWRRVKEHRIAQWTIGYVAVSYGIQHAVTLTSDAYKWPDQIIRVSMTLLALGLPLAMVFAWYHGERASRRISAGEMTLASLLLVLISLVFYAVVRPTADIRTVSMPVPVQQASVTDARNAAASPKGAISVAVLPFLNLSSDKEQEFFSDGMTEEITAALAKVPDLRVVARTSAFEFKGKNVEIQKIGEQLHATHLIEGSVRKAGNRLRITAQLIKANDGTHVWAEDYDRDLTDVFAIQEDIARAITTSLHMTLGLKPGENLVNNRNIVPELYQQFLRAKARSHAGGNAAYAESTTLLEQVVARDPNYAPAWAWLGLDYGFAATSAARSGSLDEARRSVDALGSKMESASRRAIQLDPNLPDGFEMLAVLQSARGQLVAAEDLLRTALTLDTENPDVLHYYSILLARVGRLREALPIRLKLQSIEPFVPSYNETTAGLLWLNGQNDESLALSKTLPVAGLRARAVARVYATTGQYREAANALTEIPLNSAFEAPVIIQQATRLLRSAPTKAPSPGNLTSLGRLGWVYLYVGAPEQSIQHQERMVNLKILAGDESWEIWHSAYAPVRRTERFKSLIRKAGLVDYWRAKGWPAQCHPTTGDDFECN